MINRPSHAQLSLVRTRAALQSLPTGADCRNREHSSPLAQPIDIQRWRRKRAATR